MTRKTDIPLKPHILKLQQLINKGFISHIEIGMLAEKTERTVYLNMEGKGDFSATEMMAISKELSRHGHNELAEMYLSRQYQIVPAFEAKTNGEISDELMRMTEALGHMITGFNNANREDALERVNDLKKEIANLQAECERISS